MISRFLDTFEDVIYIYDMYKYGKSHIINHKYFNNTKYIEISKCFREGSG